MKAMICEMCQGNDLVKIDGMFVCQFCGTKYSVEEARKLIIEGTIKVDHSDEIRNLYELARRAKDTQNSENAQKFYEQILIKDPSSWEANFYSVYFQAMNCVIADIHNYATTLKNNEKIVLQLLYNEVNDDLGRQKALEELSKKLIDISMMFFAAASNHYKSTSQDIMSADTKEFVSNVCASRDILYNFGDLVIEIFGERFGDTALACWKTGVLQHKKISNLLTFNKNSRDSLKLYSAKIKNYSNKTSIVEKIDSFDQTSNNSKNKQKVHNNKKNHLRKDMLIGLIICAFFALVSILMVLTDTSQQQLVSMSLFFIVLSVMFLLLSLSPKSSIFMFGKFNGLKKKSFVIISVILAFLLFGLTMPK